MLLTSLVGRQSGTEGESHSTWLGIMLLALVLLAAVADAADKQCGWYTHMIPEDLDRSAVHPREILDISVGISGDVVSWDGKQCSCNAC